MFTFKQKLVLSMMLVVTGISVALLLIAQRKLQSAYEARIENNFNSEFALFAARQDLQIGALKSAAAELTTSVRFIAVLNEYTKEHDAETAGLVYSVILGQLAMPGSAIGLVPVYRAYDENGRLIVRDDDPETKEVDAQLARLEPAVRSTLATQAGYLNLKDGHGEPKLHWILLSKCIDDEDKRLKGTLLLAAPLSPPAQEGEAVFGLFADGKLQVEGVSDDVQRAIRNAVEASPERLVIAGREYAFMKRSVSGSEAFPNAFHVSLQSREPLRAELRDLRRKIALAGAFALAAALAISLLLASSLTEPIDQLVEGTRQIERGSYELKLPVRSRDEIGQLTESFNRMAAGLLLREKYRSVLDMVSDKSIAEDLLNGQIELGGEERQVSVLFCDIRGFTALTEKMEPREVIQMLNEHFTPLTRIVHEHHGAVDKFVGDLIMAIFGAPKTFGNEAANAARCALRIIEERARLNEHGQYKISVGIGVATGKVVAGRMGSRDRLNYTVLGPRVNLASRLCSQAGRMEVVIDEETWRSIEPFARALPTPELRLKGFAETIHAYKLQAISATHETKEVSILG